MRSRNPSDTVDEFLDSESQPYWKGSKGLSRRARKLPNCQDDRGPFRVVMVTRGVCEVELENGSFQRAGVPRRLSSRFGEELVCGDLVRLHDRPDGTPIVTEVLPRTSSLFRADPKHPAGRRLLLANVEMAGIVATVVEPPWLPGWVERYLVAFLAGGIAPLLIFQKADLLIDPLQELERWMAPYRAAGIPHIVTSARSGMGVDRLRELLRGKLAALVGRSGVGKSSLLERLVPGAKVKIGELSASSGTGRHTTTRAELFRSPDGLALIDTPGIRSLDLSYLTVPEVARGFPDFWALHAACRFGNCTHRTEPGCAVLEALDRSELEEERYGIYLRLLESLAA